MPKMKSCVVAATLLAASISVTAEGPRRVAVGDWPEMRGPSRDGISRETGLIDKWALNGENFLWRAPYGGRSAPIVMGNRVYVQNPAGRGVNLQERVMALDADSGKVVWEYKFNLYQSDVPPHRIGWASPAADPETGNIYAFSGGAEAIALSRDGKLLWSRSFGEEFAAFTTHGGRTMSPVIDGDLVIVSAPVSNWGTRRCAAIASWRSTSAQATSSTSRIPAGDPTTRRTRRRSSPPSTACGSSSPDSATAVFTQSRRRPARRSGAFRCPSAPSTQARSFAATTCSCRTATRISRATSSE